MSDPLQTQVGGDHYKRLKYQPLEFILDAKLDFVTGNIVKYIARYPHKNGVEDLKKALHYVQFLESLEYIDGGMWGAFLTQDGLATKQQDLLGDLLDFHYYDNRSVLASSLEKEIELLS